MSVEIPQALIALEVLFARQRSAFTAKPMPSKGIACVGWTPCAMCWSVINRR